MNRQQNSAAADADESRQTNRTIGVLISGRGSNLQALIDAIEERRLDARIAVVISNREQAEGLQRAASAGIETLAISHRAFPSRDEFDAAVARELAVRRVSLVCLAGFMRLIGAPLLDAFPHAILNIHPSLLPAFAGVDAQRQALDYGVKVTGATVHLVTSELDGGPILLQAAVSVRDYDTVETLSARILIEEHRIYPEAVRLWLDGGWSIEGRRFVRAPHQTPGTSR
jgi:phosphoribosylglycinamide formyltransferase-1